MKTTLNQKISIRKSNKVLLLCMMSSSKLSQYPIPSNGCLWGWGWGTHCGMCVCTMISCLVCLRGHLYWSVPSPTGNIKDIWWEIPEWTTSIHVISPEQASLYALGLSLHLWLYLYSALPGRDPTILVLQHSAVLFHSSTFLCPLVVLPWNSSFRNGPLQFLSKSPSYPLTSWRNLTGHHPASHSQPQPEPWRKEIKQVILPSPSPSLSPQAIVIRLKGIAEALENGRPVKNASVLTFNYHKSHKAELLKMSYVVPCASNHPRVLVKNADYWAQLQTNCLSLSSPRNRPWDKDSIAESWFGEVVPGNTSKGRQPIKGVLSCQLLPWATGVSSHWELWKQHSTLISESCHWRGEGVEVFGHQLSSVIDWSCTWLVLIPWYFWPAKSWPSGKKMKVLGTGGQVGCIGIVRVEEI